MREKMAYWFNANKKEDNMQTLTSQKPKVLYGIYISKTHINWFIALNLCVAFSVWKTEKTSKIKHALLCNNGNDIK